MHSRIRFIEAVRRHRTSVADAAATFGVSRKTAYKWLARHDSGEPDALKDRSRRPLEHPQAVDPRIAEIVVAIRREQPLFGPRKLIAVAGRRHPRAELPSESTVARILRREGLVPPRRPGRCKAVRSAFAPLGDAAAPNDVWTADYMGRFAMRGGGSCNVLTVQDAHSRKLLAAAGHARADAESAKREFLALFRRSGLPARIHTDNGGPFASNGLGRLSALSVWWMKQDIEVTRSRPGHPEDNPRHERMHRDLRAKAARPPERGLAAQQRRLDESARWLNDERPHDALGGRMPSEAYAPSAREYVERPREFDYPDWWEKRRIQGNGHLKLKGEYVFVGRALEDEHVALEEVDDDMWRLIYRRTLLAMLVRRGKRLVTLSPPIEDEEHDAEETE